MYSAHSSTPSLAQVSSVSSSESSDSIPDLWSSLPDSSHAQKVGYVSPTSSPFVGNHRLPDSGSTLPDSPSIITASPITGGKAPIISSLDFPLPPGSVSPATTDKHLNASPTLSRKASAPEARIRERASRERLPSSGRKAGYEWSWDMESPAAVTSPSQARPTPKGPGSRKVHYEEIKSNTTTPSQKAARNRMARQTMQVPPALSQLGYRGSEDVDVDALCVPMSAPETSILEKRSSFLFLEEEYVRPTVPTPTRSTRSTRRESSGTGNTAPSTPLCDFTDATVSMLDLAEQLFDETMSNNVPDTQYQTIGYTRKGFRGRAGSINEHGSMPLPETRSSAFNRFEVSMAKLRSYDPTRNESSTNSQTKPTTSSSSPQSFLPPNQRSPSLQPLPRYTSTKPKGRRDHRDVPLPPLPPDFKSALKNIPLPESIGSPSVNSLSGGFSPPTSLSLLSPMSSASATSLHLIPDSEQTQRPLRSTASAGRINSGSTRYGRTHLAEVPPPLPPMPANLGVKYHHLRSAPNVKPLTSFMNMSPEPNDRQWLQASRAAGRQGRSDLEEKPAKMKMLMKKASFVGWFKRKGKEA